MPVGPSSSEHFSLVEATEIFPRHNGKKVHFLTVKRWIVQGYRGVRLDAVKCGNQWLITREAIGKFQADCTAKALGISNTITPDAQRNAAAARERLRERGFYDRGLSTKSRKKRS